MYFIGLLLTPSKVFRKQCEDTYLFTLVLLAKPYYYYYYFSTSSSSIVVERRQRLILSLSFLLEHLVLCSVCLGTTKARNSNTENALRVV